ncbi:hypothetical protein [Clostridium ihumii]|uniref:hypothetical protein n=1 Tax=Clostridium ihumii TaxID=1470356 RepID=UPI00058ECAEC|nr:hypothetical protein [Clostridium ihumii]
MKLVLVDICDRFSRDVVVLNSFAKILDGLNIEEEKYYNHVKEISDDVYGIAKQFRDFKRKYDIISYNIEVAKMYESLYDKLCDISVACARFSKIRIEESIHKFDVAVNDFKIAIYDL